METGTSFPNSKTADMMGSIVSARILIIKFESEQDSALDIIHSSFIILTMTDREV